MGDAETEKSSDIPLCAQVHSRGVKTGDVFNPNKQRIAIVGSYHTVEDDGGIGVLEKVKSKGKEKVGKVGESQKLEIPVLYSFRRFILQLLENLGIS